MARPFKEGLEYFALDCVFDTKVELLVAEFGSKGIGVYVSLLQLIYKKGYFTEWNRDEIMLFARKINESYETVTEILERCFERNLFDYQLFKNFSILTSSGIQKQFLASSKKRKEVSLVKEFCLIKKDQLLENTVLIDLVNSPITIVNSPITGVTANNNSKKGSDSGVIDGNKYTKKSRVDIKESIKENIIKEKPPSTEQLQNIIDYFNQNADKKYKLSDDLIKRMKNLALLGYTMEQFKLACDKQIALCKDDPKSEPYMNPITIFRNQNNFERIINTDAEKIINSRKEKGLPQRYVIDNLKPRYKKGEIGW